LKKLSALLLATVDSSGAFEENLQSLSAADYPPLLELAAKQRVDALLANRLLGAGEGSLPEETRRGLRHTLHRHKFRALRMSREFSRIASAFGREKIGCIPLKGIDLARRVYGDPALRPFEDLDLLVRKEDLSSICDVMEALGYRLPPSLLPLSLLRRFHFHVPFVHPRDGYFVEIHWELADRRSFTPPDPAFLWSEGSEAAGPFRVLRPDVYAAYLAVHLCKHGFLNSRIARHRRRAEMILHPFAEQRLIWYADIDLLLKKAGLDAAAVVQTADGLGCGREAREVFAICSSLFSDFPGTAAPLNPPPREGLLERHLKDRLMTVILKDLDGDRPYRTDLPWLLTTNKRIHVRPIRFLSGGLLKFRRN
jgi:hypothetical protein